MPDFLITDHGSIIAIQPLNDDACRWLDGHTVCEPWQWQSGGLCIEHRYAGDLVDAIEAAGFVLS